MTGLRGTWGWRFLASVSMSAGLLALFATILPWGSFRQLWLDLDAAWLGPILAGAVAGYAVAAARLMMMLPGRLRPVGDALRLNLLHGLGLLLLPARLGEVVFITALGRTAGTGAGRAVAIVTVQRLQDLGMVGLMLAAGILAGAVPSSPVWLWLVLAAAVPALVLAWRALPALFGLLAKGMAGWGRGRRFVRFLLQARRHSADPSLNRPPILAASFLFWALEAFVLHCAFRAFGHTLDVSTTLYLTAGLSLIFAIPVQTIAGLGMAEGGLAALLILTGMAAPSALSLGVAARLLLLAAPLAAILLLWIPVLLAGGGAPSALAGIRKSP